MSISLPNGAVLSLPVTGNPPLSAAVTRILHLANFSAELKTRDIQTIFKDWENEKGGFRIKWLDDVNALVVFNDAGVAKRAYLAIILKRPSALAPPAVIKPYDRPDAAQIIQSLAARAMGHRSSLTTTLTSGNLANLMRETEAAQTAAVGQSGGIGGFTSASTSKAPFHSRTLSSGATVVPGASGGGFGGFKMPLNPSSSASGPINIPNSTNNGSSSTSRSHRMSLGAHQRTGSASSSWGRTSLSGALGFGGSSLPPISSGSISVSGGLVARLPTHSEGEISSSSADPSRSTSSSSNTDPIVVVDSSESLKSTSGSLNRGTVAGEVGANGRRQSLTADKALREVQKALMNVEAQD